MKKLILILLWIVLCANACNTIHISTQIVKVEPTQKELYSSVTFDTCIQELKIIEGFRHTPYPDGNYNAIGYGHQIVKPECIAYITKEDAEVLLIKDFKLRIKYIHDTYNLTGNKLLALSRFTFNLGHTNTTRLLSKNNIEGRWLLYCNIKHKVNDEYEYRHSSWLYNCRKRELELWLS